MLRQLSIIGLLGAFVLVAVLIFSPDGGELPVPVVPAAPDAPVPVPDATFEAAASEYEAAKSSLEEALLAQAEDVDPEILEPVNENLGFIERAVMEVTIALAENPDNDSLKERLLDMYDQQVQLLGKALNLSSDQE